MRNGNFYSKISSDSIYGNRGPNPGLFCRCNPSRPSRRAAADYGMKNINVNSLNEIAYLKEELDKLMSQVNAVNIRISELQV